LALEAGGRSPLEAAQVAADDAGEVAAGSFTIRLAAPYARG
jgi:hypothetical protein